MQADLERLEEKVFSLVTLCQQLQANNSALQEEITSVRKKNEELAQKVEGARLRIERLLANLPGTEHVG
jgi:cell division protein ZapB